MNIVHTHTRSRGACWDKFRPVDLSDTHSTTLLPLLLLLCVCAHINDRLHLKAGLFTFFCDGGWRTLLLSLYVKLHWRSKMTFLIHTSLSLCLLFSSAPRLRSLFHARSGWLVKKTGILPKNLHRLCFMCIHVTVCEPGLNNTGGRVHVHVCLCSRLSSSLTAQWHPAVIVALLRIGLWKALVTARRRSVLTHWRQLHPLFQLNGKNRLPVSWRHPLSHFHMHTLKQALPTAPSVSHPSHSNPSLLSLLPFFSPSFSIHFSPSPSLVRSLTPLSVPIAVTVVLPHAESHMAPDWRKVT